MLAKDIITNFRPYICRYFGNIEKIAADSFNSLSTATNTSIIWISSRYQDVEQKLNHTDFAIAICPDTFNPSSELIKSGKCLILTQTPRLLAIKIAQFYFTRRDEPFIHPTAIIHPNASIGNGCTIGAYATIGIANIAENVSIGEHCVIKDNVIIGNNVSIGASSILGSEQSANERDLDGRILKFPHLGKLSISNNVCIGVGCIIAKGVFDDTIIGEGTIIDSQCLIGHNSNIGQDVFISSCCQIGGSVMIHDRAILFSDVKTRQWISIGYKSVIGQGSLVIKNVPDKEMWYGTPAKFIKIVDDDYRPFI